MPETDQEMAFVRPEQLASLADTRRHQKKPTDLKGSTRYLQKAAHSDYRHSADDTKLK